jgi:hypothetical protein
MTRCARTRLVHHSKRQNYVILLAVITSDNGTSKPDTFGLMTEDQLGSLSVHANHWAYAYGLLMVSVAYGVTATTTEPVNACAAFTPN